MTNTPVNNIKTLNLIHKAMLFGQVLFVAVSFYIVYAEKPLAALERTTDQALQLGVIVLTAVAFFAGTTLMKRKIVQIRGMQGAATDKFAVYRTAAILQWALLEAAAIFSIVCFILTGNYALLVLAVFIIVFFGMLTPNRAKIAFLLGLSGGEADDL